MSLFDRHPALRESAARLVERRRAVLATDVPDVGRSVAAAAALWLVQETGASLTVFGATPFEAAWTRAVQGEGYASHVRFLTHTRAAKMPSLLDPEHIILADMTKMTLDTSTTLWRGIAPILRSAPHVVMFVPMDVWPKNLAHVELVSHFDQAVFVHSTELVA